MINIIGKQIRSTKDTYKFFESYFKNKTREHLYVIGLRDYIANCNKDVTINSKSASAQLSVSKTFDFLKENKCNNFILAHNHPNRYPLPSPGDVEMTKKLLKISKERGIPLKEHLVYSGTFWEIVRCSFNKQVEYN